MSDATPQLPKQGARATLVDGLWRNHPVSVQILGICSALAVTNRLESALVMGGALCLVTTCSCTMVSLLRRYVPRRVRLIVEVAVISTFVIIFDQFLKAQYYGMSKQLGPYVGLIITNCIVMGRAEAFALNHPPGLAALDGLANGAGYALVLAVIGLARELLGTGAVMGVTLLSADWYTPNRLCVLGPGAFLAIGFLIALVNALRRRGAGEGEA